MTFEIIVMIILGVAFVKFMQYIHSITTEYWNEIYRIIDEMKKEELE